MKRLTIKIFYLLLAFAGFFVSFSNIYAATIYSTTSGGSWSSTGTWMGGIIPGQYDDVIIDGNVTSGYQLVNNILINSSGALNIGGSMFTYGNIVNNGTIKNTTYSDLNIYGDILNNGTITTYSSYSMNMNLFGNINNNGTWIPTTTNLKGSNKQIITNSPIGGSIYYDNNLEITGTPKFSGAVNVNGKTLKLNSGNKIEILGGIDGVGGVIGSGGVIEIKGNYTASLTGSLDNLVFSSGTSMVVGSISSNNVIVNTGTILRSYGDLTFSGNLINYGTIKPYYSRQISIYGQIQNNGIISNEGGSYLTLKSYGDIINNGTWANSYTYLESGDTGIKNIVTTIPIGSNVYYSNNLEITGTPKFSGAVNVNGKTLKLNSGNKIEILGGIDGVGGVIGSGGVIEIKGNYTASLTGSLDKIIFSTGADIIGGFISSNYSIVNTGTILRSYSDLTFSGNLINYGTIKPYYSRQISIYGQIQNNGIISDNGGSYLTLKSYGDIINNGTWGITYTYLESGDTGIKNIVTTIPIGSNLYYSNNLEITGNPKFNGIVNVNGKTLKLNSGNKIEILGGMDGVGGIIGSGGVMEIRGSYTASLTGSLDKVVFSSGTDMVSGFISSNNIFVNSGVILKAYSSLTLSGNLINNGNITSYLSRELSIYGNLLNNGTIAYSNGYSLSIKSYGNIQNNGTISSSFYLKWPSIPGASNYYVSITGQTGATVGTNEYGLSNINILTYGNQLWYAEGNGITTPKKCINVPGCINSDGSTNPISPFLVYGLDGSYYNNNLISSKNINYYSKLFFDSVFHVKSLKNQLISYIFENTSLGDPVNLANGEFDYDNTLMSYNSEGMPFEFKVKYRTNAYYNGPLGNKFDHNYNIYLTEDNYGNIDYHDGKLGAFKFTKTSTGYLYNDTINANLTMSGLNYVVKFDDQKIYSFGLNSRIQNIKDAFGNVMIFTYNNNSELTKITDTLGREYLISYYPDSRIKDLTDFNGNKVEFIYFGTGDLYGNQFDLKTIKMTNSGSTKQIGFTYNTGSTFENSHNILKLIDSAGNTYVENIYDSNNRVLTQKYGSGTINYDYTLDENNEYVTKNIVTDREGNVIEYYFNSSGNTTKKIVKKSSGDLEYNYVYDGKSNLIKEIKPLGNGVKYTYDSHNNILEKRLKQDINAADSSSDIVYSSTYDLRYNKPSQTSSPGGMLTNYTFDDKGNITRKQLLLVKDYEDHTLTISGSYVYNSKGQLIKETNARGLETTFEYSSGNLVKVKKGTGATAIENNFQYDSKGNLVKIIDGRGKETILSYNNFNLITQKLTPESIATQYTYNNLNKKTNEKIIFGSGSDLNTDYEYDILDNLIKVIQDIDANKTLEKNVSYDLNSRIIQEKLGNGATIKYIYDENGFLIQNKVESGAGVNGDLITTYTYDNNERLISETNPRGKTTNYEYDLFDRIIKKTLPDGTYESYYYDNDSNIIKIEKYSSGNTLLSKEENIYDRRGKNLGNKKYLLGGSGSILSSYSKYDENGNITKSIDSKGKETNYSYDIYDRLIETSDSLGNKIINTYDKNNNIVSKKVKQSNNKETTTTYLYDDDNRLLNETKSPHPNSLPGGEGTLTKTYTYNKLNQITSITDEKGNITNYTYDYAGKVKSETKVLSSGNIVTSYTYDERGNMLSVTDGKGNTTNYEYDNLNRLVKQTYPDSTEVNYTYDKNNNIKTKTDPNGTTVTNTYDDLDRLVSRTISTGSGVSGVTSESYVYDDLGRLIEGNDSNNHKLTFDYDSLNRLTSENQSGSIVGYSYDNNNNLLSITNPNNNVINYTYDDINRVTSIKKNSDSVADYTYAGLENTSISLGNSTSITKTYDELSRLSSLNNGAKTYNYTYDDVGNITSDSFKNYDYDEIYRLTGVNNSGGTLESLSYDKAGNRINNFNALIGNGANYEYSVNNLNQYVSSSGSVNRYVIEEIISELEGRSSGGSGSGEVQSGSGETNSGSGNTESGSGSETGSGETESSSGETNTGTTNEESGTLDIQEENNTGTGEETNSSSGESGSGVAVGILKKSSGIVYGTSEEESGSGITTYSGGLVNFDDSSNYVYDNNGNIINNGKYKFIYDYKNRIVEVTNQDNETIVSYEYDVLNRRYKKESNSKLVEYTFSNENILEENITNSGSSTITKEYINGLGTDNLIAYDLDNVRYYFNLNHLGSVDGITDNSGNVLINYEYDSYGNAYVNNSGSLVEISSYTGSTYENERLYIGREFDSEINLYYLRARYYDSKIGRFISRDPIDISDDVNLYSYVGNNPVNYNDLDGLYAKELVSITGKLTGDVLEENLLGLIYYKGGCLEEEFCKKEEIGNTEKYVIEGMSFLLPFKKIKEGDIIAVKGTQQIHHFLTNKSKNFTPKIKEITDKYGLDLNGDWNKSLIEHAGRHVEKYHDFMLNEIKNIDKIAKGSKEIFLKEFKNLKNDIIKNPDILYKKGW